MKFLATLIDLLSNARQLVVLTGAGVSAESGVPTFRDALTGLWARFRPGDLATPEAFRANPCLVWDWYAWRQDLIQRAENHVRPSRGASTRRCSARSVLLYRHEHNHTPHTLVVFVARYASEIAAPSEMRIPPRP